MPKKKKLNSSNPKYQNKGATEEKEIKRKKLMCETKGIKVYGIWYK